MKMVFGILTVLLAIVPFVLFSQPLVWAYIGEGKDLLNKSYRQISCYDGIHFEGDLLYTIGVCLMILALVLAVVTIIFTIINLAGKDTNGKKPVGVKIIALFFFLVMLGAVAVLGVYLGQVYGVKAFKDVFESTVGYGLLGSLLASIFALIFAPRKKCRKKYW